VSDQPIDLSQIIVSADQITGNVIRLTPTPIFEARGHNGQPIVTVHHDGHLEYGPGYQPDQAARQFWDAVEQHARNIQYGPPMNARINAHLKAGQEAERKLERLCALAEQWQSAMRPGEKHPAAAAVLRILDGSSTAGPEGE
jgi:hypothetical protein